MKTRLAGAILGAALTALWAASVACQELPLGYLPSGAGPFATFSKTNEIAAQMAIDEINAAGGIGGKKLRIVAFDTAGGVDLVDRHLRRDLIRLRKCRKWPCP